MKYIVSLILILACTDVYAQAVAQIRSHSQLSGTGANTHAVIDTFISSKAQASGLASLDASGNVVQSAGTVTLSGGYVKQTNGTATGTQLTSVQINSGTASLSAATIAGVAAPYPAQSSGTCTELTANNTKLPGNTAIGTNTAATDVVDIDLGSGNMLIKSNSGYPQTQEIRGGAAADGNLLATKIYQGKDSAGNSTNYAGIYAVSSNVTNGSEAGSIDFYLSDAGSYALRGRWKGLNLGIGTSTPPTKLTVAGDVSIQASGYLTFNPGAGTASSGYGIRDNAGTMQYKNTAGAWTDIPSGATGGGWIDNGTTITENTVTDQVVMGSTTASNRQLTCVGSSTFYGQVAIGSNTAVMGGLNNTLLDLIIGDSDTGLKWMQDGDLAIYGNSDVQIKIDGNNDKVLIGTTTSGTKLNVGGTVTAEGFSGNGAELTGVPVDFSAVTGSATSSQLPLISGLNGSATSAQLPINASFTGTQSTFGTTTPWNNSTVTIVGSNTSPLSIITKGNAGTNSTSIMTGTSTPAPNIVVADRMYADGGGNYYPHYAFDNVVAAGFNQWAMNGAAPTWISYNSGTGTSFALGSYKIAVADNTYQPTAWTCEGSNDNITFTPIDWRTGQSFTNNVYNTYSIATSTTRYQIYRINISAKADAITTIAEIQLIPFAPDTLLYAHPQGYITIGTTTLYSTSTTGYVFQVDGSGLATSWGVTCYGAIKSIVGSGSDIVNEGYNAVMDVKLFKHHPKVRNDITLDQAEEIAKIEYVKSFEVADYATFKTDRLSEYLADKGTDTANWTRLREDFEAEHGESRRNEFYVLPDKEERIRQKKVELESDTSITSITPISDDPSTPDLFKRGDKRILDLQPQIGALMGTAQYQDLVIKELEAIVGSLTSRLNNAGL